MGFRFTKLETIIMALLKENQPMGKGRILGQMGKCTKETGKMGKDMDMGFGYARMGTSTTEIGSTDKHMGKELSSGRTGIST
jgi:hypothetical protein